MIILSTDAKRAGNLRHQSKLDRIVIQPYKEDGLRIRNAASEAGQSVQAFILDAVFNRLGPSETALGSPGAVQDPAPLPEDLPE